MILDALDGDGDESVTHNPGGWPRYNLARHEEAAGVWFCQHCALLNSVGNMTLPCSVDDPCRCCLHTHIYLLNDNLRELRTQVQRVRELHRSKLDRHPQGDVQRCIACLDLWPCATIRALDGDSDD